jgi:NAD(P)-dependent dehydrogenase (short-subunit alcohol dehydrogenase family)
MPSFQNQVALVTGAASGIGRATAEMFARQGAKVVVSDINETAGAEVVAHIQQTGGEAVFIRCNVADINEVNTLHEKAVETFGRLDIGINNAGIGGRIGRTADQTAEDWHLMMAVNLSGVFFCMQAQLRQMMAQGGGKIVNVASIAGIRALPNGAPYTAAKHGVIGLTKAAAVEYARQNIRVNAVCPVFTRSAMVDSMFAVRPDYEEKLVKMIPLNRYGQPDDIAQGILWLCSDENSFMTGQALQLDGGMTAS